MIDSLLKLALVLLVVFGPLLFAWGMYKLVVRSERKEWKKKFDAIHRGDKFTKSLTMVRLTFIITRNLKNVS